MGLDLILYKRDNSLVKMTIEEELQAELAYGRKTWVIANFFTTRCESLDGDVAFKVTKQDWDEFMDSLRELNDPNFREKVEDLIDYDDSADYYDEEHEKIYEELENWLDRALDNDSGYQLGFTWELYAVLRWFDADAEVQEAFKEGCEVILIQSY